MSMTPGIYFEAFVRPSLEDFDDHQDSVRHAFNAAFAASHMADHYWSYCLRHRRAKIRDFDTIGPFVKYLSDTTDGAFRDIRSIANAFKHLYSDEDPRSSVSSAGAIEAIMIRHSNVREVFEDHRGNRTAVFYTTKRGETRELLPVLRVVFRLWEHLTMDLADGQ
jgi:hypothetical protein